MNVNGKVVNILPETKLTLILMPMPKLLITVHSKPRKVSLPLLH